MVLNMIISLPSVRGAALESKVSVFTLTRNEEMILPFFLKHYSEFADEIVVYDNKSTDRTIDIAKNWPNVRVEHYDTGGVTDDSKHRDLKNSIWRGTGPGWKIVVDCDEFIWYVDKQRKSLVRHILAQYANHGIYIPPIEGWEMVGDKDPTYDGTCHIWEIIRHGVRDGKTTMYDKRAVFKFPEVQDMGFDVGAHHMRPRFSAGTDSNRAVGTAARPLKLLHFKYTSLDKVQRRATATPLSPWNRRVGCGLRHANPEFVRKRWNDLWVKRVLVVS
jgi:hypothetical protein